MMLDTYTQKKTTSSANGMMKTETSCARIKQHPDLWLPQSIEDLKVILETSKLIDKIINKTFQNVGIRQELSDRVLVVQ